MWDALPAKRSPAVAEDIATAVYSAIRRCLGKWRDDPDRLAVACACWTLAGYASFWLIDEVALGYTSESYPYHRAFSDDEARDLVTRAIYRRNHKRLRHQAEGMLYALEATAADADEARRHRIQVDSAMIECRPLNPAERLAKLREMEREESR